MKKINYDGNGIINYKSFKPPCKQTNKDVIIIESRDETLSVLKGVCMPIPLSIKEQK